MIARYREPGVSRAHGESGSITGAPPRSIARRMGRVVLLSDRRPVRSAPEDPALDRVLGGKILAVAFQPIATRIRDRDGLSHWQITGVEALVRAYGDRAVPVRPEKFLPLLERAGLMHRLFLFVLAEGLASARIWEKETGARLRLSLNLHAAALLDDALPRFLLGVLQAASFNPARLTLELTEGAPILDLRHAAQNLKALRSSGVRVALDDFGAGFSTRTRLEWLECDELKIDRILVRDLERFEEQRCVVESLIALAHDHGMSACAEGVESGASLDVLGDLGCDRAQGYLIGRPVPAGELQQLIQTLGVRPAARSSAPERQMAFPEFGMEGVRSADCDTSAAVETCA